MHTFDWRKYLVIFGITAIIFSTAIYISNFASNQRLEEIKSIQDKIAVDLLSSETQFTLLAESSCDELGNPAFSEELNSLTEKLSYTESALGSDDPQVIELKRYYSLLEIKDYLLNKKISEKCKTNPRVILYFYSNAGECPDCEKMGYVLTFLRNEYPELRVYAFDYNLDLSALRTLRSILKIKHELPVIVVDGTPYYGFKTIEELEIIIPELKKLRLESEKQAPLKQSTTSTEKK